MHLKEFFPGIRYALILQVLTLGCGMFMRHQEQKNEILLFSIIAGIVYWISVFVVVKIKTNWAETIGGKIWLRYGFAVLFLACALIYPLFKNVETESVNYGPAGSALQWEQSESIEE